MYKMYIYEMYIYYIYESKNKSHRKINVRVIKRQICI